MSRGFDYFNRTFTFHDPPSARNPKPVHFTSEQEAYFSPPYSRSLRWSRWFSLDKQDYPSNKRPTLTHNRDKSTVTIQAEDGIRWVGFVTNKDKVGVHRHFADKAPKSLTFQIAQLAKELEGHALEGVDVRGANGQRGRIMLPKNGKNQSAQWLPDQHPVICPEGCSHHNESKIAAGHQD